MNYKLPRQATTPEINAIVAKQMKKEKWVLGKVSKENLKEIRTITRTIQKKGLPWYLVKKKLPNGLGYGIFLHPKAPPIQKGEVIAPYAGKVSIEPTNSSDDSAYMFAPFSKILLNAGELKALKLSLPYHPKRCYSLRIDAQKVGNFTRFINHSEKPNVAAFLYTIQKNALNVEPAPLEIIYLAKKTIQPGEQLLVCYEDGEKSYWGALKIKPFPLTPKTFTLSSSLKLLS